MQLKATPTTESRYKGMVEMRSQITIIKEKTKNFKDVLGSDRATYFLPVA